MLLMICTTCFCEHLMLLNVQRAWNDFRLRVKLFLSFECLMSLITRSQLASVLLPMSTSIMTSMPSCSITAPLCSSCGSISRSVRTVASCIAVSLTLRACMLAVRRSAKSFAARRPMLLLRLPLGAVEGATVGAATVDARLDVMVDARFVAIVVVAATPAMGRVVVVGFASDGMRKQGESKRKSCSRHMLQVDLVLELVSLVRFVFFGDFSMICMCLSNASREIDIVGVCTTRFYCRFRLALVRFLSRACCELMRLCSVASADNTQRHIADNRVVSAYCDAVSACRKRAPNPPNTIGTFFPILTLHRDSHSFTTICHRHASVCVGSTLYHLHLYFIFFFQNCVRRHSTQVTLCVKQCTWNKVLA